MSVGVRGGQLEEGSGSRGGQLKEGVNQKRVQVSWKMGLVRGGCRHLGRGQ